MMCTKCGYHNSSENIYCSRCGRKLDSNRNHKRILPGIVIIACAAIVILMIVLLAFEIVHKDEPTLVYNATEAGASESTADQTQERVTTPVKSTTESESNTTVEKQSTQPTIPEGYISYVDGDWESTTLHDGNSTLNTHAFVFSQELVQCREMTITMEVSMKAGTKCKDWQMWGRVGGKFKKLAKIDLPNGNGRTYQTVKFDTPISLDAIVVTPTVPGGYSWSLGLAVSDVWVEE